MRLLEMDSAAGREAIAALERRGGVSLDTVQAAVGEILAAVGSGGDGALRGYAERLDKLAPGAALRVSPEETRAAWEALTPGLKAALETAVEQIRAFAERQMPQSWAFEPVPGLVTGQLVRAIDAVGCYVPGGRHPLPSTMLMTVTPAQVAGVERIVVVSPNPAAETLATAHLLGVTEFYRIGGAHAVAALAYGTETIGRVAKIVGPGNLYVTAAKRTVSAEGSCAIDMLAGPTEIVVASDKGTPAGIASDLVAQAEHDPAALAIFITTRRELAEAVLAETERRAAVNEVAAEALRASGLVFVAPTAEAARELVNRLAPEHLTVDLNEDLSWVRNAGSVFVGEWSPQPMGDYISGPNHTLPTGGLATLRGGLSVNDFVKLITVQQYAPEGLKELGPQAMLLAEAEGLLGHAEAIATRLRGER
jgi:histidinol dehydrogenase